MFICMANNTHQARPSTRMQDCAYYTDASLIGVILHHTMMPKRTKREMGWMMSMPMGGA
jgi:hypothetical protein